MNRRYAVMALLGVPLLWSAPSLAQSPLDASTAQGFVQRTGQAMMSVVNGSGSPAARRDQVASILRHSVDVEGVGRFVLGRYWRSASLEEQQAYLQVFEETLIRNLSARFGEYQGVQFQVQRTQMRDPTTALVATLIARPNATPFTVEWQVSMVEGQPKIVDVLAEGTSLRLTQRSEYSAVLTRNGGQISALLDAMRGQIRALAAKER